MFNPDLTNEGLKAWLNNIKIITQEYTAATGKSEDEATVEEVLEWIKANKEFLRTKLPLNTALFHDFKYEYPT